MINELANVIKEIVDPINTNNIAVIIIFLIVAIAVITKVCTKIKKAATSIFNIMAALTLVVFFYAVKQGKLDELLMQLTACLK